MTEIAPPAPRRTWDLVLTIALLVAYLGWSLLCCFAGALLAMAGDGCGASSVCDDSILASAFLIGALAPIPLAVLVIIAAVIALVRKKIAFWIPLAGSVLALGIEIFSFALANSGVTSVS